MGRELIISLVLHGLVFVVMVVAGPLDIRQRPDFGEVIRVSMVSMPAAPAMAPEPVVIQTPQAVAAEPDLVELEEPTTRPAVEVEEPEKQPEPKEEPKEPEPKPQQVTTEAEPGDTEQAGTAEGQVDVETPTGGAIAGATVDNAGFTYPFWFDLAWNKINQAFRVPVAVDSKIECQVYFQVIKSGRVVDLQIMESSGVPQFDDACMEAIGRAAPFPPLPRQFLDEIIGVNITFANRQ